MLNATTTDTRWNWAFVGSLLIMIIIRWYHQVPTELDVDTSTWISSAISTAQSPRPWWTILNFCDSRPLTVLPLALVEMLGIRVTWAMADGIGVLLWVGTLIFVFLTFRHWFSAAKSFLFTAPLVIFQATHLWLGFMTYNSEHICILMLTVGFWGLTKLQNKPSHSWLFLVFGLWLGWMPFAKIQIVPMGLMLAAYAAWEVILKSQWRSLVALIVGGILPLVIVNGIYYHYDHIETFWNDYFWNYYYYSFSTVHSDLEISSRFSPLTIGKALFRPASTRIFWMVQILLVLIGGFTFLCSFKKNVSPVPISFVCFSLVLAAVSLYAVLQAGNPFDHYLLLLYVPAFIAVSFLSSYLPTNTFRKAHIAGILLISVEGIKNILFFPQTPIPTLPPTDVAITKAIETLCPKDAKMTIWGYADRFFVYTHKAAGNRLSHTYWVYTESPLQAYRQRQFIKDLEENRPILFLDAMVAKATTAYLPPNGKARYTHFPLIRAYINQHYKLVKEVEGVWFFQRKNQ